MEKEKSHNKWFALLLFGLGFVICLLVIGIVVVAVNNKLILNTCEEVEEYLAEYADVDKTQDFVVATDRALEGATSSDAKYCVYASRFNMLYNYSASGNDEYLEQLVSDAYSMESIKPTVEAAYNIYLSELVSDNKAEAEKWFDIAKERGLMKSPGRG